MDVEQQRPNPVVELPRDPEPLAREVPAGLLGRGVGVVGCREGNLVEALIAERDRAVAGPLLVARSVATGGRPSPATAAAAEDQEGRGEGGSRARSDPLRRRELSRCDRLDQPRVIGFVAIGVAG